MSNRRRSRAAQAAHKRKPRCPGCGQRTLAREADSLGEPIIRCGGCGRTWDQHGSPLSGVAA